MKKLMLALACASMIVSTTAVAQEDGDETRTQFVSMEGLELGGSREDPGMLITNENKRGKFARLSSLKKSMLPKLVETSNEPSLD